MRVITVYHKKNSWMNNQKEINDLIQAAGYTEVTSLTIKKIHDQQYLPEMKLDELKSLIEEYKPNLIVFNEPLSVRQLQKLDEILGGHDVRLVDKVMLILEIFSKKANSKEIQLQIQLAEFKYVQPRLKQEIGASINTEKQARDRGAGETLQNIMKSDFRSKISQMESELENYRTQQGVQSKITTIPILGFYSVGKTTIFNILTDNNRETNAEAFTTMLLKSSWSKILGFPLEIIDTIGLVGLPPMIVDSFSIMLERVFSSPYLIICLDAANEPILFQEQLSLLDEYYQQFAQNDLQYHILFMLTKCDQLTENEFEEKQSELKKNILNGMFPCKDYSIMGTRSDRPKYVKQMFKAHMEEILKNDLFEFTFENLNPSQISKVHNHASVISEEWKGKTATIKGVIPIRTFQSQLSDLNDFLKPESKSHLISIMKPAKEPEIPYDF